MQALTRLNPTDPVRFDGMNTILGEIEARDEDLLNKINVCFKAKGNLTGSANDFLENGVGRDTGNMTELPGAFGNIINFNSDTGDGCYLAQLYVNRDYIGYRTGADNNLLGEPWQQIASTKYLGLATYANGNTYPWSDPSRNVIIYKNGNMVNLSGSIYIGNGAKGIAALVNLPNCATPYGAQVFGTDNDTNIPVPFTILGTQLVLNTTLSVGMVVHINVTYVSS